MNNIHITADDTNKSYHHFLNSNVVHPHPHHMTYPVHASSFDLSNWMPSNLHNNYSKSPPPLLNYPTASAVAAHPQYVTSSGMCDLNYYPPLDGFNHQYGRWVGDSYGYDASSMMIPHTCI